MNQINKTPIDPEEDDRIADVSISREELNRLYEERKLERKRKKRWDWAKKLASGATFAGVLAIAVLEGAALVYMMPLKEIQLHVVYQRDDGTWVNNAKWEDLPANVRKDSTINVVWSYVMLREGFSKANAGYAWRVVSALSSTPVREQYQKANDPKNPQSPYKLYGDIVIDAQYVGWEPACEVNRACPDEGPPAYRVWYDRTEIHPDGTRTAPQRWVAVVGVKRDVPIPQDRIWQRWTFNAPQIQVTEYPGASRQGVTN
jgi:type IV secretory pathway component VirB8